MKKFKVFYERINNLEDVMNEWLVKNQVISIINITQSTVDEFIVVTILYIQ